MALTNQIGKLLIFALILGVSAKCDSNENSSPEQFYNIDDIMASCNESFRTSFDYLRDFNATGRFPDETDKTPMCYIRCYFEKLGIIKSGNVDKEQIRQMWWPAIDDSVEVCQKEGENESNPCVASYAIVGCLMLRALDDARNNGVN